MMRGGNGLQHGIEELTDAYETGTYKTLSIIMRESLHGVDLSLLRGKRRKKGEDI